MSSQNGGTHMYRPLDPIEQAKDNEKARILLQVALARSRTHKISVTADQADALDAKFNDRLVNISWDGTTLTAELSKEQITPMTGEPVQGVSYTKD